MGRYERMTKPQLIAELEAVREPLERLAAIVDGSRDAIFISDEDSRFVLANAAASGLTGYSEEELLEMRIPDLHEEVDLDAYLTHHGSIMNGQAALTEAEVLRKDGTKVAAEFNNRRIVIAGKPHMHTTARDITERKRAEKALRESEERYRTFVRTYPGISHRSDLESWTPLVIEGPVEQITGYSREEILSGTPRWDQLIHPEEREALAEGFDHEGLLSEPSLEVEREYRIIRKDGEIRWIHDTVRNLPREPGRPREAVGELRDITERRRMEDALRDSRDSLRELATRLDEVREEERRSLARELHDEVGQTLVAMRIELELLEGIQSSQEDEVAHRVHSMIDLTDDSLARVNRIAHELRSPVLEILGLEAAIEAHAEEVQKRSGIDIELDVHLRDLVAHTERDVAVERVLGEALANATRHAQASRSEISARAIGKDVVLEVLDDGIGITDEQLEDPRSFGLIGMRERVKRVGGRVEIRRRPEGGTQVRAFVPIEPANR